MLCIPWTPDSGGIYSVLGKVTRGYILDFGSLKLYADPGLLNPRSARVIAGVIVGACEMRSWDIINIPWYL